MRSLGVLPHLTAVLTHQKSVCLPTPFSLILFYLIHFTHFGLYTIQKLSITKKNISCWSYFLTRCQQATLRALLIFADFGTPCERQPHSFATCYFHCELCGQATTASTLYNMDRIQREGQATVAKCHNVFSNATRTIRFFFSKLFWSAKKEKNNQLWPNTHVYVNHTSYALLELSLLCEFFTC